MRNRRLFSCLAMCSIFLQQAPDNPGDAGVVVAAGDLVGRGLHLGVGVGHGYAQPRRPKHGQVVGAVAEGHGLLPPDAQMCSQGQQRLVLAGVHAVDLDVVGDRRGGHQLREELRNAPELPLPLVQILGLKEHLQLLQRLPPLPQGLLQIVHRHPQALYDLQHVRLGGEVGRAGFIHAAGHPAALVLIAVVDHGQRVHVLVAAQGQLQGHVAPVEQPILRGVVDPCAVGDDEVAHAGQALHRLRDAPDDAARGRHRDPASLRRGLQGPEILGRDALFIVQQRPVQVEGDQLPAHARFSFFCRPKTVAPYSSAPWASR